mmetsp:Transcript_41765/g.65226  ORF Transcript_41765/g.65226 Transcript_41765/m.65226 type:complete len:213 (-) Transcript_41765:146-784(-)
MLTPQQATHTTIMMLVSMSPNLSSFSLSGESLSSVSVKALAIFPISVAAPVFTTTPRHLPYTRSVAENKMFSLVESSSSTFLLRYSWFLFTLAASPVRAACSALRVVDIISATRTSAGTLSPTATSTMSPGTNSLALTILTLPSLRTLAWSGLYEDKASIAASALLSCHTPMHAFSRRMDMITQGSTNGDSPDWPSSKNAKAVEIPAATNKI